MASILEVDGLTKSYGDFTAVNGISFAVEEGEVFGLLGPNGAGKTQTISMLTGVIRPSSGSVHIGGHDLAAEPEVVKQLNGLVPQDLALYPSLSARTNLSFFGRIYGLSGSELKRRVDDVLEIVALTDRADQAVEKYSGGMKRRVNIAAGLVHEPRLLFLDEPTVGVDPQSRNHIFESVLRLNRERGLSIVYTSHYMEEVELLCNRVAIMDQGEIIALDTVKNLIALLGGGVIRVGVSEVDDALLAELSALPGVKRATRAMPPPGPPTPGTVTPGTKPAGDGGEASTGGRAAAEIDGGDGSSAQTDSAPLAPAGPVIVLECEDSSTALVSVITHLSGRGRTITSLETLEPNLESVFLQLTGKKLRE